MHTFWTFLYRKLGFLCKLTVDTNEKRWQEQARASEISLKFHKIESQVVPTQSTITFTILLLIQISVYG